MDVKPRKQKNTETENPQHRAPISVDFQTKSDEKGFEGSINSERLLNQNAVALYEEALRRHDFNVTKTAKFLQLDRTTFISRCARLGIQTADDPNKLRSDEENEKLRKEERAPFSINAGYLTEENQKETKEEKLDKSLSINRRKMTTYGQTPRAADEE